MIFLMSRPVLGAYLNLVVLFWMAYYLLPLQLRASGMTPIAPYEAWAIVVCQEMWIASAGIWIVLRVADVLLSRTPINQLHTRSDRSAVPGELALT
jgi:hypothetical protein